MSTCKQRTAKRILPIVLTCLISAGSVVGFALVNSYAEEKAAEDAALATQIIDVAYDADGEPIVAFNAKGGVAKVYAQEETPALDAASTAAPVDAAGAAAPADDAPENDIPEDSAVPEDEPRTGEDAADQAEDDTASPGNEASDGDSSTTPPAEQSTDAAASAPAASATGDNASAANGNSNSGAVYWESDPADVMDAAAEAAAQNGGSYEQPPSWAGSPIDDGFGSGILLAEQTRLLQGQLMAQIELMKTTLGLPADTPVVYDADNLPDILAYYALRNESLEDFPYQVKVLDSTHAQELASVYWDMTNVQVTTKDNASTIHVIRKTCDDLARERSLDNATRRALEAALTDESKAIVLGIYPSSTLAGLDDEQFAKLEALVPNTIPGIQRAVLLAACSLDGRVSYFWGGKSSAVGWDDRWGYPSTVSDEGDSTYGSIIPFGMDCSGFVGWAFINATGDPEIVHYITTWTTTQYQNSQAVSWDEVQPGDILFYRIPANGAMNHIGIVVSVAEDGTPDKVVHCSSDGVAVTDVDGFKIARRPYAYDSLYQS